MGGAVQRLFSLDDVVALVTGSSRRYRPCAARGLAEASARVVVNGRDPDKVAAAVAALKSEGLLADAAAFDVTDPQGVERGVTSIEQEIGSIRVLVNNAGIQRRAPLEDFPPETSRIYAAGKAGSSISPGAERTRADQHRALHGFKRRRENADQGHGDRLGQAWSSRVGA